MFQHSARKADGFIISTDLDGNEQVQDTKQCVHCGGHWVVEPGSGKIRGHCYKCNGPFCGPSCMECVPVEKLLERIEKDAKRFII